MAMATAVAAAPDPVIPRATHQSSWPLKSAVLQVALAAETNEAERPPARPTLFLSTQMLRDGFTRHAVKWYLHLLCSGSLSLGRVASVFIAARAAR